MLGKGLLLKTTVLLIFFFSSFVSKVFEKNLKNRILDYLENFGLSSDSEHGFRSSRSSIDCLIVVSDRIAKTSNRSGG